MTAKEPRVGQTKREKGRRWVWDGTRWRDAGPIPPAHSSGGEVPLGVLPELDEDDGDA